VPVNKAESTSNQKKISHKSVTMHGPRRARTAILSAPILTEEFVMTLSFIPAQIRLCVRAVCLLPLIAGAASAAELSYPPVDGYMVSRTVKYNDLDLNSQAGVKKLYRRLESMARTVCDARRAYNPEYIAAVIRPCVTTTLANAVKDVNAPLLTAHHQNRRRALRTLIIAPIGSGPTMLGLRRRTPTLLLVLHLSHATDSTPTLDERGIQSACERRSS
jgi:UrcA family protein